MRLTRLSLLPLSLLVAAGAGCNDGASGGPGGAAAGGAAAGGAAAGGAAAGGAETGGFGGSEDEPARWQVDGVTTWRGDAQAAYTMFYDDTCNASVDNQFDIADVELTARGLTASFGAIAGDCVGRDLGDRLLTLRSHGHEIVNHSWSHPDLSLSSVDVAQEIDAARRSLEGQLGEPVTFFIFPFDSFTDDLLDHLRAEGYLGARGGLRGWNSSDFDDDFRIDFDVFGPGFSIYVEAEGTPCEAVLETTPWDEIASDCRQYVLDQYVRDVLAEGGWGVRELHSVEGEGWEPVPRSEYTAHLDLVKTHVDEGKLWVAPASEVIRYRRARQACSPPRVTGDRLVFSAPSAACARHATALTYVLRPLEGTPDAVTASQGAAALATEVRADGTLLVTADPTAGPVELVVP